MRSKHFFISCFLTVTGEDETCGVPLHLLGDDALISAIIHHAKWHNFTIPGKLSYSSANIRIKRTFVIAKVYFYFWKSKIYD